jgi:accessory gene regulator protein AgrB
MIGSGLLTACLALYIFSNKSIFKFAPAPAEEQQH